MPNILHVCFHRLVALHLVGIMSGTSVVAQTATITEEVRTLTTYPYSEPNPVPILTRDARLYPYHTFEGYAKDPVLKEWKVVRLENDYIEVFVLPEVGGKIWGAIVKKTGHEFIYRNEVMKFRNIALRGPWTSGGIEFNFGVIGHTPSTATSVHYLLRENRDGSVSCIVGAMDLPSRTHWRVEIRLPSDRAYFETNTLWYNPTPLDQPYYNWMTAAAFARNDLVMTIPGVASLEHGGTARAWPVDGDGRALPVYAENRFGGHKSYHVVGELNDFFGGYYTDDDYGFGHWARYDEMPGQKLWLWALSREGGIWEDLLTDSDGQYVEFQAGRLLVQYAPGADVNPITQVGFDPGATDRWTETWFPLEGLGGLTDASREGALYVTRRGRSVTIRSTAFANLADTLRVRYGNELIFQTPVSFSTLRPVEHVVDLPGDGPFVVDLPLLRLSYASDREARTLDRPFTTDASVNFTRTQTDQWIFAAQQLKRGRRYPEARRSFEQVLAREPWNREALLGLADLAYRRARFTEGLHYVNAALQLDTYHAPTNFIAGSLYQALNDYTNALEAYGWSARSMAFRTVSYVRMSEIAVARGDGVEAARYARLALDYDRNNLAARQVLTMLGRATNDAALATQATQELLEIDPLHHFVHAESFLRDPNTRTAEIFIGTLASEYPEQILLELAVDYARRGATRDARHLLVLGDDTYDNPLFRAWRAWIERDTSVITEPPRIEFVFPYRTETLQVLEYAVEHTTHWGWRYLLALNLWALDREHEATTILDSIGNEPDFAPAYVTRALLHQKRHGPDVQSDLRRAVALAPTQRVLHVYLVQWLQQHERWDEALIASTNARQLFPTDFNLGLLHVKSLNHLDRAGEAIPILNGLHVLPSENSRESHRLYEQAHTIAAMDALDRRQWTSARRHLLQALEWPEHLGQGKPYDPEERLIRYLLARTERALGNRVEAAAQFETVITATANARQPDRLDVLMVASKQLSDNGNMFDLGADRDPLARVLLQNITSGLALRDAVDRLVDGHAARFTDLDGRLLLRALRLP